VLYSGRIIIMKLERLAHADTHERIWTIDWYSHPHPGTPTPPSSQPRARRAPSNSGHSLNKTRLCCKYVPRHSGLAADRPHQIHTQSQVQPQGKHPRHRLFRRSHIHLREGLAGLRAAGLARGAPKRSTHSQTKVKAVDWSPNDKKLVSCSRDKNLWVWVYNPTICDYECEEVLEGHSEDVKAVVWL